MGPEEASCRQQETAIPHLPSDSVYPSAAKAELGPSNTQGRSETLQTIGLDDRTTSTRRWDLDVLRIVAILGVVSIHVFGLVLSQEEALDTLNANAGVVLSIGTRWCVPLFVMISGALLLSPRAHRNGPAVFLRRRLGRLVPALVAWHLIYLVGVRVMLWGEVLDPVVIFLDFVDGHVYTALYFLWLILGLYIVAPPIAAFLAGGGAWRARGTALAAISWSLVVSALPQITALLGEPRPRTEGALTTWVLYIGLFVAGYAWREAKPYTYRWAWSAALALFMFGEVVWQYNVAPQYPWLQVLAPVTYTGIAVVAGTVFLFVSAIDLLSRTRPSPRLKAATYLLSEATFGVFLCHMLIIVVIRVQWPEWYSDAALFAKIELFVVVVTASFAVSLIGQRIPYVRRVL